jgi:hypothetical protein
VRLIAGHEAAAMTGRWERAADRWWHRSSSALASLTLVQTLGWAPAGQVGAVVAGLTFGGGYLSPDVDQRAPLRWLRSRLRRAGRPRAVRLARALDHHRATHSVPLAAGVTLVSGLILWGYPAGWLVPLQWLWHDLGDALVGKRPHGLPGAGPAWGLTGHQRGIGRLRSGGPTCRLLTACCWAGISWRLLAG